MGNFESFMKNLKNGDLDGVIRSFQPDFLEIPDDDHLWRPIHWTCFYGHIDILKLLVSKGCELQCKDRNGQTPLDVARQMKHQACEDFLTEAVKKFVKVFDCIRRNDCQTLKGLNYADVLTREESETGLSFLEVVLQSNADEVIKYVLDKRVDDAEIPPLKHYIENCPRPAAVELIQECLLYRSIRYHHADGFELSCLARTVNGHRNIVKSSFLETAAEFGTSAFITEILKKSIYNEEEWTRAKDLAILKGHKKIKDAILMRESLLKSRAKAYFSSFHTAICDNDPDVMKYIFDNGLADPNLNNEVVGTGLALAFMLCHVECIETLQQFNVDVNSQNKYFQTPLHEAISSGMTDHCSYLISRAHDIDKPGFTGFSGLQCAVMEGCENLCNELMKNGSDCIRYVEGFQKSHFRDSVALPISTRENAVTLCMKIHETIYPCFLEVLNSNKVNCSDGNENTLLHLAVKTLLPDLCRTLINCGANIEAINKQGNSPLLELFSSNIDCKIQNDDNIDRIIEISKILINSGADINSYSLSGVTVLQSASQCNSERLMLCLLSEHPDPEIVTETDLKLAFNNKWFVYAEKLIDLIPGDSLKSFISTKIFHLSMSHADPKLLNSMFVKASSDVQQSIIEDLLHHFATIDKYDAFRNVLKTEIIEPKLFSNGETLFTGLLKDKNIKYCLVMMRYAANRKCLNLANYLNQIPLQIAIETELYELISPLILKCDELNHEDINGNIPLMQLFQKLSISTDISTDEKLMTAVKVIISRGGDIYKKTSSVKQIIEFCTRLSLRNEIKKSFKIFERVRDSEMIEKRVAKNICCVCLDREVDCAFQCGHTFCTPCGMKLYRCAMCNDELTNPRRIDINRVKESTKLQWPDEGTQKPQLPKALESEEGIFAHFQFICDDIASYEKKYEPGIMEKFKKNINLNNKEKLAVNLVFGSLKDMGDFHNERTKEVNEISIKYLDKYFESAHENVVAMRLTEVILYSFCSRECKSLDVGADYFLKYFNGKYSPEIQLGAVVANSFVEYEFNGTLNGDVILFILNTWKGLINKETVTKSDKTVLGFSSNEIENCLNKEMSRLTEYIRKHQEPFSEIIYRILCQILEGINHLDSSQIFQVALASINIFNKKYKSKIFLKWTDALKFEEEDRFMVNNFYVSINILSKCCNVSAEIPFDEMILLETFQDFSQFISTNFISQRMCESLLYCICNIVDKREIKNKESLVDRFEKCFLNPKVSTEIKLASSFILSYLIEEEEIKSKVQEYLMSILELPIMKRCKSYCGFSEEEINNCLKTSKLEKSKRRSQVTSQFQSK